MKNCRELVATALGYLDGMAQEAYNDADLHKELAQAYVNIGSTLGNPNEDNLGDIPGMLRSYAKAEAIARRTVTVSPSLDFRKILCEVLRDQVDGYRAGNQMAKAAASADESLRLAREIARADPRNQEVRRGLAMSLAAVARVNQSPQASAYRLEAAAILDGLLTDKPGDAALLRSTAVAHKYVAATCL